MLTVDYAKLGLRRGERILDVGCGQGRHSFEAMRLGARVVALDLDGAILETALAILAAMVVEGQGPAGSSAHAIRASALALPFEDGAFDRIVASEVLEHIQQDCDAMAELARVLRPGGTMAVTVPAFFPEAVCWALSAEYHGNEGGHVRIYRRGQLVSRLEQTGLEPFGSHHAHALHSPFWWLRCAIGVKKETAAPVRAYHKLLVWDITSKPAVTRVLESALNPVLGKSLVVYLRKPVRERVLVS
jgi:SAM-dependent methyltransferase